MTKTAPDDDATVRLVRRPPPPPPKMARGKMALMFVAALTAGAGSVIGGLLLWPKPQPIIATPTPLAVAPVVMPRPLIPVPIAEFKIETANEAFIRDHVASDLTLFRLTANPDVLVLDFASLLDQGMMLNRIGAFAEKATAPHERVLNDAELERIVQAGGDTTETFYYGHDYSAATLSRFFALAERDQIKLNPREATLRRLLKQEGWFAPGKMAGLISVPRAGDDTKVSVAGRTAILRHELSHGAYFSDPLYAAYTHRFWTNVLTVAERDAMRHFLREEAYDTAIDELVENEAQAYIVFTPDRAFFNPARVNISPARHAELRTVFLRDMPAPWLRGDAPVVSGIAKAAAIKP